MSVSVVMCVSGDVSDVVYKLCSVFCSTSSPSLIWCPALKLLDVLSSCLGLKETPLCHYVVHSLLYSSTGVGLLQNVAMGAVVMEVGAARLGI
jgi:hypothetical protein